MSEEAVEQNKLQHWLLQEARNTNAWSAESAANIKS